MNEIQVIQQQLRLEKAHFAAALRACEAVLDRQAWISGGELAAAMSDYFAIALRRFGADASPPGATAESGRWREFLRLFEFESQRFFQALDQLTGVPVTRWRATSRMDADSIVSERLAYLRLQAVLPP